MNKTQVEETPSVENWTTEYPKLQETIQQFQQFTCSYTGSKELKRDLKKLVSYKPPRRFWFFFMSYDFCMGFHLPFAFIPDARYMIKIGAKSGIWIIRLFWFSFSVRW